MNQKEEWANEVLQSLDGIKRAEPQGDLFAKITAQISEEKIVKIIPLKRLVWVAAAACIIIAVNVYSFTPELTSVENQLVKTELLTDYSLYN